MSTRDFRTLDGIRAVAAICIVAHHMPEHFGHWLLSAQIAVDLFFVLSGFVLTHAYGTRLRSGMTPLRFLRLRVVRLYPLYLLGTVPGLLSAIPEIGSDENSIGWTWWTFVLTLPFTAMMLPSPFTLPLFPFNGVMWSVFFELVANLIWVVFWRRLENTRFLVTVICVSGALFAAATFLFASTSLGVWWSTFPAGFLRVIYSFMMGVLLYRFHDSITVPRLPPVLLLAVMPVLAALPLGMYGQLVCAVVVLPALVLFGAKAEPSGVMALVCKSVGGASYGIYALHLPMYRGVVLYLPVFGLHLDDHAPWAGLVFIILFVGGCTLLVDKIDLPARRLLSRLIDRRPAGETAPSTRRTGTMERPHSPTDTP